MPPESDITRVRHIVDAARAAMTHAAGRTRSDLDSNRMLLMALVKEIEIVGEAAFHVSAETRAVLADVPWPAIVGMRHRLIHAYFDVDHDVVWATVQEDLQPLLSTLEPWLASQQDG